MKYPLPKPTQRYPFEAPIYLTLTGPDQCQDCFMFMFVTNLSSSVISFMCWCILMYIISLSEFSPRPLKKKKKYLHQGKRTSFPTRPDPFPWTWTGPFPELLQYGHVTHCWGVAWSDLGISTVLGALLVFTLNPKKLQEKKQNKKKNAVRIHFWNPGLLWDRTLFFFSLI